MANSSPGRAKDAPAAPTPSPRGKPDLKALREQLRHKGDSRRGDGGRADEAGHTGGGP